MLKVLYHRAKIGEARISPAARAAKDVEFLVCLSVSVKLLKDGVSAYDFAMKLLEYRNGFAFLIPLDRRRFLVEHPCSNFSDYCQLPTPENVEPKSGKIWGFGARGR